MDNLEDEEVEFNKGYAQAWHEAMNMVVAEAQLWENENNKSLAKIQPNGMNEMLEGARDEIKAFKERVGGVLRSRGPKP